MLRRSAFDAQKPTLWILEGLTYYLSEDDNSLLFRSMAALSAPGSVFAATMAPHKLVDKLKKRKSKGLMSTWKWGFPTHFEFVRLLLFIMHRACCYPLSASLQQLSCIHTCLRRKAWAMRLNG